MRQLINHYSYKHNMKHINDLINLSDLDIFIIILFIIMAWLKRLKRGFHIYLKTHMAHACFSTIAAEGGLVTEGVLILWSYLFSYVQIWLFDRLLWRSCVSSVGCFCCPLGVVRWRSILRSLYISSVVPFCSSIFYDVS